MTELYDSLGVGYRKRRVPDERIAGRIDAALAGMANVVNVGAGAGSYELSGVGARVNLAVEPSMVMIRQRPADAAIVVQASGTHLPLVDGCFDACLVILSMHHWPDPASGLRELRRVATDRVVVVTWDPSAPGFWLTDYFPQILAIDREIFPSIDLFRAEFDQLDIQPLSIPADCSDGFLGAYWRRPDAYLDEKVRASISTFAKLTNLTPGLEALRSDLQDGAWLEKYGGELERDEVDLGYRIVVATQ